MSKVVMYASVSVDGFIAAENDDPGSLFEWLVSGEVALDESGVLQVSHHFVDGIEAAVAKARELAGDRTVEVAAGDVGGPFLDAGFVDEVRMDVIPVVLGSGKCFFGSVDAQHSLDDPDVVIQGGRVLHLRFRVRR